MLVGYWKPSCPPRKEMNGVRERASVGILCGIFSVATHPIALSTCTYTHTHVASTHAHTFAHMLWIDTSMHWMVDTHIYWRDTYTSAQMSLNLRTSCDQKSFLISFATVPWKRHLSFVWCSFLTPKEPHPCKPKHSYTTYQNQHGLTSWQNVWIGVYVCVCLCFYVTKLLFRLVHDLDLLDQQLCVLMFVPYESVFSDPKVSRES